jgi:hypothetical protein
MTTPRELPAYNLNGKHPADRVYAHQAISSDVYLHGEPAPSRNQVAAVLHALADHTHNMHMLGDDVRDLGKERDNFGALWAQTTGLGRYFHGLGNHLEEFPESLAPTVSPALARDAQRILDNAQNIVDDIPNWKAEYIRGKLEDLIAALKAQALGSVI